MVYRGKILDIIEINDNISQVVINAKYKDNYHPICFIAYAQTKAEIAGMGLEKKDTVKIEYYLKSKKAENRYYTSAVIETIKITKKKPKQETLGIEE